MSEVLHARAPVKGIAASIERDLLTARPERQTYPECFSCGRTFTPKVHARFCSERCREWFDNGNPPHDPHYASKTNQRWYSLPMGKHGFLINCFGCGKQFDSKGLRCCSRDCERDYREREEREKLIAEVGGEPATKRRCEAPGCGEIIPRWRKGRAVSKATRYCSRKCAESAGKGESARNAVLVAETQKKPPSNGPRGSAATRDRGRTRATLRRGLLSRCVPNAGAIEQFLRDHVQYALHLASTVPGRRLDRGAAILTRMPRRPRGGRHKKTRRARTSTGRSISRLSAHGRMGRNRQKKQNPVGAIM